MAEYGNGTLNLLSGPANAATIAKYAKPADWVRCVVIDSASTAGCPSDGSSITKWHDHYVTPWLQAGIDVIIIDHTAHNTDHRVPVGSQSKIARVTGTALSLTPNQTGGVTITLRKDNAHTTDTGVHTPIAHMDITDTGIRLRPPHHTTHEPDTDPITFHQALRADQAGILSQRQAAAACNMHEATYRRHKKSAS